MGYKNTKQRGDAILVVSVILLIITMGFFAMMKITHSDLFASSALGGHEHGRQVSEVALQRTLLDIAAVSEGLPLEALDTNAVPWYRTYDLTTANSFSWSTCATTATVSLRCERITQDNFDVYRYVLPTGISDTSSSNPCAPASKTYYYVYLHAVEKNNGSVIDTQAVYWKCA